MSDLPETLAAELLALARESIAGSLRGAPVPEPRGNDAALFEARGVFVTLKLGGRLRGCIGRIESDLPLWETVGRVARSSAFDDPRFPPLGRDELDEVVLEVSVMTPPRGVDSPDEVLPGRHGVMIELHGRRAVFLPQVANEQGWDRVTLLEELCAKAGLPASAYADPAARLQVFEAQVASE